ncbi:endoplasmic reticulum vesicle transporter-domain-containing protein [Chytridium lagenaria]|nr:endoplasmic reticulum vesicle transporter-domain-containing protein [Chytridium lagenaria]
MKLARWDAFVKMERNIQHTTLTGGMLTVVVAVVLSYLVFSEVHQYMRIQQKYEFLVDQSRGEHNHLLINVDLTIAMACTDIRADVFDASGTSLPVSKELTATPTTFSTYGTQKLGDKLRDDGLDVHQVIEDAKRRNTANTNPISGFLPALNSLTVDEGGDSSACRYTGTARVNKVVGTLHFTALGHGYIDGQHVQHQSMNFSHRIDKFSFGINYPGLINPLDKSLEMAVSNFEMFQYFISVVPTIFIDKSRGLMSTVLLTNQYAVTDYSRVINTEAGAVGIPGIFIKYEIEPISVRISESRSSFMHLLTRLCGIVGGVYVTVGIIHNLLQFLRRKFSKP